MRDDLSVSLPVSLLPFIRHAHILINYWKTDERMKEVVSSSRYFVQLVFTLPRIHSQQTQFSVKYYRVTMEALAPEIEFLSVRGLTHQKLPEQRVIPFPALKHKPSLGTILYLKLHFPEIGFWLPTCFSYDRLRKSALKLF